MRIICVEEHTVDAALAQATRAAQVAQTPYLADWGSRVHDMPHPNSDRPSLVSFKTAMGLAPDLGANRIAAMDEHGIDMQVLSHSNVPQLAPKGQAVELTRAANDRLAEAVAANPSRLAAFAALPWQIPDAAAAELTRAVKQLGFKGALVTGRPGDTFLDDPRYAPVLAALNTLKVPLYVHPGAPLPQVSAPYYGGLEKEVSARLSLFAWGWHNESGIQVIRMILSGIFDRYTDLRIISGHWGEMVPFFLQRLDNSLPLEATGLSRTITATYRDQVYVTPSGLMNLPHFEFIHKVMGADRIIYSVDYPYLTLKGARAFLEHLPISDEDKKKIAHGNAETLLGL